MRGGTKSGSSSFPMLDTDSISWPSAVIVNNIVELPALSRVLGGLGWRSGNEAVPGEKVCHFAMSTGRVGFVKHSGLEPHAIGVLGYDH